MKTSELMKKENLYKIGALALVAIFIFEMFAMGMLGGNGGSGGQTNYSDVVEGEAIINATVGDYQPYIITDIKTQAMAEQAGRIEGVDEVVSSTQGYVVSIESGANITSVYAALREMNASGRANVVLALPASVNLSYGNGSVLIAAGSVNSRLEPIFEPGDVIVIRMYMRAREGRLSEYGYPTVLPSLKEMDVNATVIALASAKTVINVPWEERHSLDNTTEELKQKYGAAAVTYVPRDYVTGTLGPVKPDYVTLVNGETLYVGNFTDKGQVEEDIANATFPDSLLIINAEADEMEDYSRNVSYRYNVMIETSGEPAYMALESMRVYEENESIRLTVLAYAIKDRIVSVEEIKED